MYERINYALFYRICGKNSTTRNGNASVMWCVSWAEPCHAMLCSLCHVHREPVPKQQTKVKSKYMTNFHCHILLPSFLCRKEKSIEFLFTQYAQTYARTIHHIPHTPNGNQSLLCIQCNAWMAHRTGTETENMKAFLPSDRQTHRNYERMYCTCTCMTLCS